MGFPGGLDSKASAYRFDSWVRKILWRRAWQPIPVPLPGESHGQRGVVGHSPWGRQELDMTATELARTHPRLVQFSSVAQSCPTLCGPVARSTPGLPVHRQLPEVTQTRVHRVGDAIQPSHPLSSPSPPAPNPSQHPCIYPQNERSGREFGDNTGSYYVY